MEENINYKIWQGFYLSFYSRAFYQYVAQHWRWRTLLFLLLLILVVWLPITVRIAINFNYLSKTMVHALAKQMPVITIQNGLASTEKPGTYYINYPGTNNVFTVIDTQDQYKNFPHDNALLLVTSKTMVVKTMSNQLKTYQFKKTWNRQLSPGELVKLYNNEHHKALAAAVISIYIFGYLIFLAVSALYLGVLSIFASIFFNSMDIKPTMGAVLSGTLIAMTPLMIIFSLLYLFKQSNALTILILLGIQLLYLMMMVSWVKNRFKNNKEKQL